MMVVEASWNLRGNGHKDQRKPENKHVHSKRHEPKGQKNADYQLPEFDTASLFSGSSQAFRMMFAEESDKLENETVAKQPINPAIKRATPEVGNLEEVRPSENGASNELEGDAKKINLLQGSNNKMADELPQGSGLGEEKMKIPLEISHKTAVLQENNSTKLEESHKIHAKSTPTTMSVDKTTQTSASDSLETSVSDKSGYSLKIVLKENGTSPRVVFQDASHDKDKSEALVVGLTRDKNIVIQPLRVDEENPSVITKQNASTMTDMDEISDLLSKEKLLASTSHPNNTSTRKDWKNDFSGGLVRSEKESNSSTHIPPSTDISMAVQVGSMEQANPQLESSPAATRLALLDSYEILASPQKNFFARNVTAKRCNTAKLTLMRAILESNLTDEEKVSSISLIYTNSKNPGTNSLRKQFPVQKMQNQILE
ncbi:hypothetical protein, partial [Priestia sp. YIM B13480]|uniref:hypothetical protein n=1 Tax=Priestia sp. YIM B13480 TaxID=3366307 RepID=UPI00366C0AD4